MEAIVKEAVSRNKENEKRPTVSAALESDSDDELRRIVEEIKTSIKVVGAGGAGGNTINRLAEMGVEGGEIIAINTDALDLLYTKAMTKVLIGASITGGIGAGNDPELAQFDFDPRLRYGDQKIS